MSESVGESGRSWWKRTFTSSERRIVSLHQHDLDAGDFGKCEDGIPRPVTARDLPSVEGHLLLQRETDRLNDASFELIPRTVRIDDEADIGRHHHAGDLDDARLAVDLDVHHGGRIHPDAFVPAK